MCSITADMGVFSSAKDRLIEPVVLSYLNSTLLPRYGKATSLTIDSALHSVQVEVELKGETSPVKIEVTAYEFFKEEESYFVVVKEIGTSREWLTALAQDHLRGRRFELGSQIGRLLIRLL
jgi:hypothetical protein